MKRAAAKAKMTHGSDGVAGTGLGSVLEYDVYGMQTNADLDHWITREKHLGYVGAVVQFHKNSTTLGPLINYTIWYNETAVREGMYDSADRLQKSFGISSFPLRIQRSVDEAILGVRGESNGVIANENSAALTVALRRFPKYAATKAFRNRLCGREVSIEQYLPLFFFIAVSVDFFLAIINVVGEKEKGLLGAMRTVGVSEAIYWLSWILYFTILVLLSTFLVIIFGLMFDENLPIFKYTEFGVMFPLLFVYAMTMVAIAFAFSSCIRKVQVAQKVGMRLFGLGIIIVNFFVSAGAILGPILMDPLILPPFWRGVVYGAFPPLAFGTVASHLQEKTAASFVLDPDTNETSYKSELYTVLNYTGHPFTANPNDNDNAYIKANTSSLACPVGTNPEDCYFHLIPMAEVIGPVYLMFFIAVFASWYFGQVCTEGTGRSQRFWFLCNPGYWSSRFRSRARVGAAGPDSDDVDENVRLENKRCREGDANMAAIRCANLVKTYVSAGAESEKKKTCCQCSCAPKQKFNAVDGLCISMEKGQIFALLGHNGAGKTTSLRMMTGLENISGGEIDVAGFDVGTETQSVRERIGVCPQHDLLWPQLTAREHLQVYSMLKGINPWNAEDDIDALLKGVKLFDVQHKHAGKFSGGMKRRLSVAIAAVGNPDVIFLDEPTTGMDPMNKKYVWETIKSFRKDKCVVLTTHSMEEADALGDRIGIMSHGKLVALGTSLELKTLHGSGYRIKLVSNEPSTVVEAVTRIMPKATLVDDSAGSLSYSISKDAMDDMPELFQWIESNVGSSAPLTDWAVSNTTLEEVFIQLAREEAEKKKDEENRHALPVAQATVVKAEGSRPTHTEGPDAEVPEALPEALAVEFKVNKTKSVKRQLQALMLQRFHYQRRQLRSNIKLFACPFAAMFVLILIFIGFDALVQLAKDSEGEDKEIAKENCDSCTTVATSFCKSCQTPGQYLPGTVDSHEKMCTHNRENFKFTRKNQWDSWQQELGWQSSSAFGICQVCSYCKSTSFSTCQTHADDSSNWKRNWNGTQVYGLSEQLPPPFNYARHYKGCDKLLDDICPLNATLQLCSCNAQNPVYVTFSDDACMEGCAEHKRNTRGGLTEYAPFYMPKMMSEQRQNSDVNEQGNEWLLVNPVGTTSRIGVVAPSGKASYLGKKAAGYSETVQARCWDHQDESSVYKGDEFASQYFPKSARDMRLRCEWTNRSDPRLAPSYAKSNLTWDEKGDDAIQQFRVRAEAKFQATKSGIFGEFPQDVVFVEDKASTTWTMECQVNGTQQKCGTSCTCVTDPNPMNQWSNMDKAQCADKSCSDPGYDSNGECPAIVCPERGDDGGKRRRLEEACENKATNKQLVFLSPSYETYDTATAVHDEMWVAQKNTMSGAQTKYKYENAREAMEALDKDFLSAAYIFDDVDAAKLKFDVTFESYFTPPAEQCDFISTFALASVRRGQNQGALHVCDRMKAEWRSSPWFPPVSDNWNIVSSTFYFGMGEDRYGVSPANWMLNSLSSAIFRKEGLGDSIITGIKPLPSLPEDGKGLENFVNVFKNVFGYFVIGSCICMTLSPLLTAMVQEKELKLQAMMRMMGMEDVVYYAVTYGWNLLFTFSFNLWLYISGVIAGAVYSGETLFTRTDGMIFILLILVYSHAQTMFCILLGNFFQSTRRVGVASFMIMMFSLITMLVLNRIFDGADWGGQPAPFYLMILPPFAIFRSLELMYRQAIVWETLTPENELSAIFGWLILGSFICFVLDAYLSQVLPRQYGVRQPWNFPCKALAATVKRRLKNEQDADKVGTDADAESVDILDAGEVHEDDDVKAEREGVVGGKFDVNNSQLLTYHLRKMYGTFTAVNDVTFHVSKGECFGLLGPNGAGKTTAISMLTGLFPPTKGNAFVCGFELKKQLREIYNVMGICPQFDICWPDLSVGEHVALYARLKGVAENQVQAAVKNILKEVGLGSSGKVLSKDLSGGMRRRLSLAMALVGEPKVVFLDEPTTGLDPETKRNIWALLDKVKVGRCIVLTTHSMDEADALCGRIGIMSHGLMRCIGTNLHLKNRYGNGYKLEIRFDPERVKLADDFVMSLLPSATVESSSRETREYQVARDQVVLSKVFSAMQARNDSIGILDYGVRQTSLEEVFLKIARESEAAFQAGNKA
jgi:ABC-type multidrug transport system ATPase subunit